jgi:DNA-binding MarR family transcriptional regulator
MNTTDLASSLRVHVTSLHRLLRKQLSDAFPYSMTERETISLIRKSNGILPSELASHTKITTQSMSQILKKFEGQGLIKRVPSKEDKRKVYIWLTAHGKNLVEKLLSDRDVWLKEHMENILSTKERELVAKALPVLKKLIE